jgi:hypothetical protein
LVYTPNFETWSYLTKADNLLSQQVSLATWAWKHLIAMKRQIQQNL